MSATLHQVPDRFADVQPANETECRIRVEPTSAQSLIRFLLDKGITLNPPEGGVARNPDYQVNSTGVPQFHSFLAEGSGDEIENLIAEWRAERAQPPS